MNMKTDSEIQQDVIAELKWTPSINGSQIGVEVADGVVTLAGRVDSYAEKFDAEQAAQNVSGVKALAVEIKVKASTLRERTDADIASAARNVLLWMTYWPNDSIKVMVEDGWIDLTGEVDWHYQKLAAAKAVRYLMGVTGVSNLITIKRSLNFGAVKSDIEAALSRRQRVGVSVSVTQGDVTLTGTVHSWAEHAMVNDAAWGTAGVHSVTNNIMVVR